MSPLIKFSRFLMYGRIMKAGKQQPMMLTISTQLIRMDFLLVIKGISLLPISVLLNMRLTMGL